MYSRYGDDLKSRHSQRRRLAKLAGGGSPFLEHLIVKGRQAAAQPKHKRLGKRLLRIFDLRFELVLIFDKTAIICNSQVCYI